METIAEQLLHASIDEIIAASHDSHLTHGWIVRTWVFADGSQLHENRFTRQLWIPTDDQRG